MEERGVKRWGKVEGRRCERVDFVSRSGTKSPLSVSGMKGTIRTHQLSDKFQDGRRELVGGKSIKTGYIRRISGQDARNTELV